MELTLWNSLFSVVYNLFAEKKYIKSYQLLGFFSFEVVFMWSRSNA